MSSYQYRLRRERELERRAPYYAILDAIIEGGYTLEGAREVLRRRVEELREGFMELSSMSDEEFYRRYPLAMVPRHYAVERLRREIRRLRSLERQLEYYAELCRENQGLLDALIKKNFVGRLREAREAFRRFCGNVTGGLTRWIGGDG